MTVAAFDTLAAAEALQNAGIESKRAKAIVEVASNAAGVGRDQLATKADFAALEAVFKADLAALRAEFKADLAALRAEFKADLAALETRLTWRMVGVMAALLAAQGALIVALLQPAAS